VYDEPPEAWIGTTLSQMMPKVVRNNGNVLFLYTFVTERTQCGRYGAPGPAFMQVSTVESHEIGAGPSSAKQLLTSCDRVAGGVN
jgi:hypothetical protein